ncbi:hypothetical protein Bca4012_103521 [Brassica carinata]
MRLPPPQFRLDCTRSFRISPNPARKVSRNIQLNSLLSPTRDGVCSRAVLQFFERKLRLKPYWPRARLPGCHKSPSSQSSRGYRTEAGLRVLRTPLAKIRAKDARSALTCGGEFNSRQIADRSVRKLLMTQSPQRDPRSGADHPLSLSISISGGKETNKDSLSNGERTGRAQLENRTPSRRIVVWRSVLSDGPGPSSLERGAREGESCRRSGPCRTTQALSTSRVVWECSPNRADGVAALLSHPTESRAPSGPFLVSRIWRCGMNRSRVHGAQLRANLEPTKGVGRLRQQDGGHGSRNPLRSPAHPGSGSAVGSSGWKSTASRGVGAFPALENPEDRVRSRPVVLITHQVSKVNSLWSMEQCRQGSRQNGSVTGKRIGSRGLGSGSQFEPVDCWRAA